MIRIVTDSASMITPSMRDAHRISVVPITIVVDGKPHREGVDLRSDDCYAALARGATVTTSTPSPGEVLGCYESLTREGASAIVSVHTGRAYSGVVNAATIAAAMAPIPVRVVDTASASFVVALAARAAARAAAHGDALAVASAAADAASRSGSVFVIGAAELARRGGRFTPAAPVDQSSIFATDRDGMSVVGSAADADDAVERMVEFVTAVAASQGPLCVAVGDAACGTLADAMTMQVSRITDVAELLRYNVGPSVVAHTGVGTVGAVFAPLAALC